MLNKDLFNTITAGLESYDGEYVSSTLPYSNSEVQEELLAIDDMDNIEVAVESSTESIIGALTYHQEAALESNGMDMSNWANAGFELATEAVTNMIKRGAYNVVIYIKKAAQKIMELLGSIFGFLGVCNGRLKSYAKLIKKYRKKLIEKREYKSDEKDKEVEILNLEKAHSVLQTLYRSLGDFNYTDTANGIKPKFDAFANTGFKIVSSTAAGDDLKRVSATEAKAFINSVLGINISAILDAQTYSGNFDATTADTKIKSLNDNVTKNDIKEKVDEQRESVFDDVESIIYGDARSNLIVKTNPIEKLVSTDLKGLRKIKKVTKDLTKASEKVNKQASAANNAPSEEAISAWNAFSALCMKHALNYKYAASLTFKLITDILQRVLKDMAKVIAG